MDELNLPREVTQEELAKAVEGLSIVRVCELMGREPEKITDRVRIVSKAELAIDKEAHAEDAFGGVSCGKLGFFIAEETKINITMFQYDAIIRNFELAKLHAMPVKFTCFFLKENLPLTPSEFTENYAGTMAEKLQKINSSDKIIKAVFYINLEETRKFEFSVTQNNKICLAGVVKKILITEL